MPPPLPDPPVIVTPLAMVTLMSPLPLPPTLCSSMAKEFLPVTERSAVWVRLMSPPVPSPPSVPEKPCGVGVESRLIIIGLGVGAWLRPRKLPS